MRLSTMLGVAVLGGLFVAGTAMAQAGRGQGAGARGQGAGFGQDPLQQVLTVLGELNLRPDFTLTQEQKVKLQAVRDEVRQAQEKWRADHAADLAKLQEAAQAARQAQDQDKMREVMTQRRELMQGQPSTEDAANKVKALLTAEQAAALEKATAERREEMRQRMGAMGGAAGQRGQRGQRGGGQ